MYVMFCAMYWQKLYAEIAVILEMICYFITLFKVLFVVFFCITLQVLLKCSMIYTETYGRNKLSRC